MNIRDLIISVKVEWKKDSALDKIPSLSKFLNKPALAVCRN